MQRQGYQVYAEFEYSEGDITSSSQWFDFVSDARKAAQEAVSHHKATLAFVFECNKNSLIPIESWARNWKTLEVEVTIEEW